MAQLSDEEILTRIVQGTCGAEEGLLALVDRDNSCVRVGEGQLIDFKEVIDLSRPDAAAELARDVLGFSNAEGGLLLVGVTDDGQIIGHREINRRRLRDGIGTYTGTRVDYEVGHFTPAPGGKQVLVPYILVRRSTAPYPNLLRKDIELRSGLVRKIKYSGGSLFYREGGQTLVEPVGGETESRARALRFTGASPRTRSSFLLVEDRPGLRLYSHINDRFFGRGAEVEEVLAKFEDPRGKGVSLAGLGGIGKTELAIRVVSDLYKRGKFHTIYSGSAKQSLLGPSGHQQADPAFVDLASFLRDLAAWLGLDAHPGADPNLLASDCLRELSSLGSVLLFVDNLETIQDPQLFSFLDNRLPGNCWLITTGRLHKIRNFVYPKEVRELEAYDAAHLLRHELKRQGLAHEASTDINELTAKARQLFCHPLAIRWFAWACHRDPASWANGPGQLQTADLETFCVAHTLGNLPSEAQKVLGATVAAKNQIESTAECLAQTSGVTGQMLDQSLFELECAGLITFKVNDENGLVTYLISPLAEAPALDLARKNGWEETFVKNLKKYVGRLGYSLPENPLIRDLTEFDPRGLQQMPPAQIAQLQARVDRAIPHCPPELTVILTALKAECQRHSHNLISADELYQTCAEQILKAGAPTRNERHAKILLEAATVAKMRSPAEPQVRRAIRYLEAIHETHFAPLRVLGMLAELHALLGDRAKYEGYLTRVTNLSREAGRFSDSQLAALDEALARARAHLARLDVRGRA